MKALCEKCNKDGAAKIWYLPKGWCLVCLECYIKSTMRNGKSLGYHDGEGDFWEKLKRVNAPWDMELNALVRKYYHELYPDPDPPTYPLAS